MMRATIAMAASMLLGLPAGVAAQTSGAREPQSALDFMVEAVQLLCRPDGDKIESAQHLIVDGWRLTDTADHYDKDFGVGAPVPLQNQHERGWRGPLADGRASLSVDITDYRDPALRDRFSVNFLASPETAIDLEAFQRRIGMTLQPLRPAHAGRPTSFSVLEINGRPGPTIPARFGQMQHYRLEPAPAGIEIEATRTWGAGFPEQWLRIRCSRQWETTTD